MQRFDLGDLPLDRQGGAGSGSARPQLLATGATRSDQVVPLNLKYLGGRLKHCDATGDTKGTRAQKRIYHSYVVGDSVCFEMDLSTACACLCVGGETVRERGT